MTERLYYQDSHLRTFTARVTGCEAAKSGYTVTLDRTAFFPEGGGQSGDRGALGGVHVLDTHEKGGEVCHYTEAPLPVGAEVTGEIDWDFRFSNMQNHSGEHIVSGLVHSLYGYDNVGFHMGADGVIIDFSGYLTPEALADIELKANAVVWENRAVRTYFPAPDELASLAYRSKLDLTENVRIVEIEDCDRCACCAPHVARTGEIGLIRIFESQRRKDGVRIRMLSGKAAFLDYLQKGASVFSISALLSARPDAVTGAVERVLAERDRLNYELVGYKRAAITALADSTAPTEGSLVFFDEHYTADDRRLLCNLVASKCAVCAVFSGTDGEGYQYVAASKSVNLRDMAKPLNTALGGRGGGTPEMIQGSVTASRAAIEEFFSTVR